MFKEIENVVGFTGGIDCGSTIAIKVSYNILQQKPMKFRIKQTVLGCLVEQQKEYQMKFKGKQQVLYGQTEFIKETTVTLQFIITVLDRISKGRRFSFLLFFVFCFFFLPIFQEIPFWIQKKRGGKDFQHSITISSSCRLAVEQLKSNTTICLRFVQLIMRFNHRQRSESAVVVACTLLPSFNSSICTIFTIVGVLTKSLCSAGFVVCPLGALSIS